MIGIGVGVSKLRRRGGGGAAFDPDYQAVLDYATSEGYTLPSGGQQVVQNNTVVELKDAGLWNLGYALFIPATDGDSDFASLDFHNPSTRKLTLVNSPTFVPNVGFMGDGVSAYINSNFNPVTDADGNFKNNNTFGGFQTKADAGAGGLAAFVGNFSGSSRTEITNDESDTRIAWFNHRNGGSNAPSMPPNQQDGLFLTRSNSDTFADIRRNGVLIDTDNNSNAESRNANFDIFSRGTSFCSDGGGSAFVFYQYMNDTQIADFENIILNYLNAI